MRPTLDVSPEDLDRAQEDLEAFANLIGRPLTTWQLEALRLDTRQTCLVAPRQTGKSWSLATLATWWAFRHPAQMVLIVSAGEMAAGRLLREIQRITTHPLLKGSVTDETQSRVIVSSGSEIRSLPASERQVRGWSADLLIADECAFISEDLLTGAAIPTTMARPDARIVLASTPWGTDGAFYRIATAGLQPGNPVTRTFRWSLSQAPWVSPEAIQQLRESLSPLRFRAEVLGEWVPGGDSYFSHEDLLACTAAYPLVRDGSGAPGVMGLDWGRQRDAHAIVVAGLLEDYGVNQRPVVIVPWCETSRRGYDDQFAEIADVASRWSLLAVRSETNGPGGPATDLISRQLTRDRVEPVFSTQREKEAAYAKLAMLLEQHAIVLPDDPELLRQLGGIQAEPTISGGLRIAARTEKLHDDLPDALTLAVAGLPAQLADVPARDIPEGTEWVTTPGGVRVPVPVTTLRPEASFAGINGGFVTCPACSLPYPAYRADCRWCSAPNPDAPGKTPAPAAPVIASGPAAEAEHVPNAWNPHLMRCPSGHIYDGKYASACPQCKPGTGRTSQGLAGLPAGLAGNLGAILKR